MDSLSVKIHQWLQSPALRRGIDGWFPNYSYLLFLLAAFLTQLVNINGSIVKFEIWDTAGQTGKCVCVCVCVCFGERVCLCVIVYLWVCVCKFVRTSRSGEHSFHFHCYSTHSNKQKKKKKKYKSIDMFYKLKIALGQERYRSLAPMYYRGAQAAIVVYDITHAVCAMLFHFLSFVLVLSFSFLFWERLLSDTAFFWKGKAVGQRTQKKSQS